MNDQRSNTEGIDGLAQAIARFSNRLSQIVHQLDEARNRSDDVDSIPELMFDLCGKTLVATNKLMNEIGLSPDLFEPFLHMAHLLEAAKSGYVHPSFQQERKRGKPRIPIEILTSRGHVAAVQQFLIDNKMSKKDSEEFVFNLLSSDALRILRCQSSTREMKPRLISRWRSNLMPRSRAAPDTLAFNVILKGMKACETMAPRDVLARRVLREIAVELPLIAGSSD